MSSKIKIKMELQGFKLEIEGSREDLPQITRNLGSQIAGMLAPAANIIEGRASPRLEGNREPIDASAHIIEQHSSTRRTKTRRPAPAAAAGGNGKSKLIVWDHDANAWGTPLQSWKAVDKALWLLYVAKQVAAAAEMTLTQMVSTFDKLFRTAGKLNKGNLSRDFGKLNAEPPPKVQYNGTVDPPTWYLTDAGTKYAETLVKTARGEAPAQA